MCRVSLQIASILLMYLHVVYILEPFKLELLVLVKFFFTNF